MNERERGDRIYTLQAISRERAERMARQYLRAEAQAIALADRIEETSTYVALHAEDLAEWEVELSK